MTALTACFSPQDGIHYKSLVSRLVDLWEHTDSLPAREEGEEQAEGAHAIPMGGAISLAQCASGSSATPAIAAGGVGVAVWQGSVEEHEDAGSDHDSTCSASYPPLCTDATATPVPLPMAATSPTSLYVAAASPAPLHMAAIPGSGFSPGSGFEPVLQLSSFCEAPALSR